MKLNDLFKGFYTMINSYELKKKLFFNCLYSKTYLFENINLNNFNDSNRCTIRIDIISE